MTYRLNNYLLMFLLCVSFVACKLFQITYMMPIFFIIYLLLPSKYAIYNLFFVIPFMSLFDNVGFRNMFSVCIFITLFKLIIAGEKPRKSLLLFIFPIIIIELLDISIYGLFKYSYIPFMSLLVSYILFIICVSNINEYSMKKMFYSLFIGLLLSVPLALIELYFSTGTINIVNYRFYGLFRDPNYYSFFILLLIIILMKLSSIGNYNKNIYIILLLIIGFLSTSKMFLISILIIVFLKIITSWKSLKKNNSIGRKQIISFSVLLPIIIFIMYFLSKNGFLDLIYDNYINRFNTNDLTTGRLNIQIEYLKELVRYPNFLLFGGSNSYYQIFITNFANKVSGEWIRPMTAHNMYLDIILSWGLLGSCIYVNFIKKSFDTMKIKLNANKIKLNINDYIYTITLAFCFFSLSFLSADCFALVLLISLYYILYDKDTSSMIEE